MNEEKSTTLGNDGEGGPTYLGDGKFQFKSQGAACYMHPLGWVSDREDGKGIAMCLVTDAERRLAEFQLASVMPMPLYTPVMATAGSNALLADGILALNRTLGAIQLSIAGEGVLTGALSAVASAIARAIAALATAAVANAGPIAATTVLGMWPLEAGQGSDTWNGQNLALLSLPLTTLSGKQTVLPGRPTIDLPVRGSLVMNGDHLEFNLLKTGGALSKAVPVLNAVRDAVTGLDSIIIPGIDGAPERIILINPVPTGPLAPPHTGNSSPVPVTPVHTGTTIEPIDKPLIIHTPAPEQMFDFIYWQLGAKGSGVEPVYVVVSGLPEWISDIQPPNRRHYFDKITQGSTKKGKNTVIDSSVDVAADIAAIKNGQATIKGNYITVNGRTYEREANGTLYPTSGEGLTTLERSSFEALGVYNKFGNTARAEEILSNMKNITPEAKMKALDVWMRNQK